MRLLLVVFLMLPLSSSAVEPSVEAQLQRMAQIDRFVWNGPAFLPRTSLDKIRKLGRISSEISRTEKNLYADGDITYTTIVFENGLEVYFRTFGSPLQLHYILVTVSSPKWVMKNGLRVGSSLPRVIEALGPPTEAKAESISYSGETEQVVFTVSKERVSKIVLYYYAD